MNTIYVIDLFAGAGGFTAGVHAAGHRVLACVEHWDRGLAIHYANFPECLHVKASLGGDLEAFAAELTAFVASAVPEGAVWHLHASPPCQSFSIAQRQKKPTSALVDAEADSRSNLLKWSLELIRLVQPPRWSLEQVPTAMPYLRKHAPWIFEEGVRIYPKVYGYEFGAPTMRKRLYMGQGWTFEGMTTALDAKKRKRCEAEHTLGLQQTNPDLCRRLVAELNEPSDAKTYTVDDLAIKTSANKWCTSKAEREAGMGPNKWVPCSEGAGLRPLSGRPAFATIASYPLWLYKRVDPLPERHHRTYLDGTWAKHRALTAGELAAINGMPTSYTIDSLPKVSLEYYDSLAEAASKSSPPHVQEISLRASDKVRGVGNGVVSTIAQRMFT